MSYQVLARKWRPKNFKDLVGQSHVVQALTNALDNQRLHHAYLFTGTRGVGKTTLARIFAKALNCEQGVSASPCGVCSHCTDIDQGSFPDLIEVDAASRTKVEQTRELLDNVPFAPVSGRFKVYLIDEVHMFSSGSFNALLKTLEEPPEHVKFLLATTDPQKVPVTVLSRCLQFNLKPMPMDQIHGHLSHILKSEDVTFESPALKIIARSADGSMRDALSLMDQAINYGAGAVIESDVRAMLGVLAGEQIHLLIAALAQQDAVEVLAIVEQFALRSVDFLQVLQELLLNFHRLALFIVVPNSLDDRFDDAELMRQHKNTLTAEDVQLFYQIGLIGQRDLPLAPDPRSGFEMVMLRMLAFIPKSNETTSASIVKKALVTPPQPHIKKSIPANTSVLAQQSSATSAKDESDFVEELANWSAVVNHLRLGAMAGQLANNCSYLAWNGRLLQLSLDVKYRHLLMDSPRKRLLDALQSYLGKTIQLEISVGEVKVENKTPAQHQQIAVQNKQLDAEQSIENDSAVQHLKTSFGARVLDGSIKPIN